VRTLMSQRICYWEAVVSGRGVGTFCEDDECRLVPGRRGEVHDLELSQGRVYQGGGD